ncbi:MAG: hypothetical protein QOG20_312 [Pseudonocardiales bacterium]|jgi:hypothetical protein|nr:hypothetical protein [Pseudonocardiales bacterium]
MLAAVTFAFAATLQNGAVVAVVAKGTNAGDGVRPSGLVRGKGRRTLFQTPSWLAGIALAGLAAVVHAGALFAPVAIVQPIGVLAVPFAVPFAVVIAAARTRTRPRWPLLLTVAVCRPL